MHWSDRIGRRLKPQELHIFLAVVEHGNMAKAAEHLSISRPVVSKAVASLERIVGVRLFDRTSSGVEPTRYGEALFKRGVGLFDELRQTVRELEFLADPNSGELRVGCTEVTAAGFVSALIAEITKQYPGLAIRTELGSVVQQYPQLRERRCELFIARAPAAEVEPDTERELLFHDWPLVAVGPHSKWAKRRRVELNDLARREMDCITKRGATGRPFPARLLRRRFVYAKGRSPERLLKLTKQSACKKRGVRDLRTGLGAALRDDISLLQGAADKAPQMDIANLYRHAQGQDVEPRR